MVLRFFGMSIIIITIPKSGELELTLISPLAMVSFKIINYYNKQKAEEKRALRDWHNLDCKLEFPQLISCSD